MSSIHLRRAKVWLTSEFNAEWIHNAVDYCRKNPEGMRGFEGWLVASFGQDGARKAMLKCAAAPRRRMLGTPPAEGPWMAQAAVSSHSAYLCVSEEALRMYADYVHMRDLAAPVRVKPPIKRRRAEGSIEWLARRHTAHLDGHKVPEMDWVTARAIALSEFDRIRDMWEGWHTDQEGFFDELLQRGKTTILSPQVLEDPDKDWVRLHKIDDAFRGRVYSVTLAHMVWLHASELLEDLFDMGLTTSSQIEREYKKDRNLMLRLIACFVKMEGLSLHIWSNMTQVISASENIAPCLVRSRSRVNGLPNIQLDRSPAGRAVFSQLNDLENFIVQIIVSDTRLPFTLCDIWMKTLAKDPHAADRFDGRTFEVLSELAAVHEFILQMEVSTFGKGLMECARALDGMEHDLWAVMCPMTPPSALRETGAGSPWGRTYKTMVAVRDKWRDVAWSLNMQGVRGPNSLLARIERREYLPFDSFDEMWETYDLVLWEKAASLAALGGNVRPLARHFGLYDVADETRPTCTRRLLGAYFKRRRELQAEASARLNAARARAEAQTADPVIVTQTVAQSAHAYLTETGAPKEKVKTRKDEPVSGPSEVAADDKHDNMPDFLPSGYKLGRKVLKVFHRILDDADDTSLGAGENGVPVRKGQIRWDVFEKAMKRIGFEVCQTAGSSVRFDPPAKNARPITFHRPHPDSTLAPHMIKWIGARLKRNYGWTSSSFTQGVEEAD
ncbi:hypothetical protein GGX14DRAFT_460835 [Mycena pura]|uniref:Type II toxin-antitoxin system HicA family toxin n=1 Tax=Mycena pura TaxID=153505 RepID=A0AAD6V770_9AGAR|nr:hypothetical protein GGX14DRAFT_460835 [Mycena pura]